jgi:hypothetical protein
MYYLCKHIRVRKGAICVCNNSFTCFLCAPLPLELTIILFHVIFIWASCSFTTSRSCSHCFFGVHVFVMASVMCCLVPLYHFLCTKSWSGEVQCWLLSSPLQRTCKLLMPSLCLGEQCHALTQLLWCFLLFHMFFKAMKLWSSSGFKFQAPLAFVCAWFYSYSLLVCV